MNDTELDLDLYTISVRKIRTSGDQQGKESRPDMRQFLSRMNKRTSLKLMPYFLKNRVGSPTVWQTEA